MKRAGVILLLLAGLAGSDTIGQETADFAAPAAEDTIPESLPLLPMGGFDHVAPDATHPTGWAVEPGGDGEWAQDTETKLTGPGALKVVSRSGKLNVSSEIIEVSDELRAVSGGVMAKGEGTTTALLRWRNADGVVREDPLRAGAPGANGWHRFSLSESEPPENADRFALVLITEARDGEAAWWDGAQLYGEYERVPKVGVYYNQVGYESQGPKCFTAYSNFAPASATFEIRSDTGESVYGGSLGSAEKITDINGRDWDYYYLRGEFTDFERGGAYRIRVTLDGHSAESDVFDIAKDLLWDKVLPVALNHFTYQRSGVEIPNFQAAAHLDDAVDPETKEALPLSGGWYDNGLGAKLTNPYVLWKLAQAYDAAAWRFDALDTNRDGVNDILGELVWGADYVKRLLSHETTAYQGVQATPDYSGPFGRDTDNAPGTADDRHAEHTDDTALHLAGLACLARYVKDRQPYVDTVAKALDRDLAAGWRGPGQFAAAMNLYLATREDRFGERAQELFPGVDLEFVDSINAHDDEFGSFSTIEIGMKFTTQADALLRLADNPFGVCTYGPPNKPVFFSGPDGKDGAADGNTQYVLQAAEFMARTYRFAPKPEYLRFIHNQLNWLLGDNPFGLCLVEGLGHERAPAYHDLRVFTGTRRGAMPGAIAKGIGPKGPGDDRPYFDLRDVDLPESRTNACDIRNNALMVSTIAHLKRFRFAAMPPR